MPILKQLVANSSSSKRRSRVDLTAEMISAPLGDFRHTMHVGRAGDAFGDTSFLSSKGEDVDPEEPDPKPGLLSRKFRSSSKRSLSVTRSDRRDMLGSLRDSALFVKNAVSLPQLNEKEAEKGKSKMPKSLSASPVKKIVEEKQVNGASGHGVSLTPDSIRDESEFGEPTDLPVSIPKSSYGMKHAESIMSFHVDLGPSMLGDILGVMDKSQWDLDDLDLHCDDDNRDDTDAKGRPYTISSTMSPHKPNLASKPKGEHLRFEDPSRGEAYSSSSSHSTGSHMPRDSSSLSSCTSVAQNDRYYTHGTPTQRDNVTKRVPAKRTEKDLSFMDEEDDEIRV
ncbi:cdc42 effector protein 4 [Ambystoma mexicanum]|uniref:cdc42 effector protein 4 n=1 Tax=Ambystoma mexicanum TaxID=8296 RepID=UPI0037E98DC6